MEMEKEKKELIEKIVHEIAEDIIERFEKQELKNDIGLLSGKSGISLFLFYYARYTNDERYERYAQKLLESVFEDINNGSFLPTYCSGIAGVCWTIIHLVEEGFIEKENLDVLNDLDKFLEKAMKSFIENNDYDFLHGATGIAYYFTKRYESDKKVIPYLEYYVEKLNDYAIYDEKEKTAKIISTVFDENEKTKQVYNLSMSHGMSSIVIILCKISGIVEERSKCLKMIGGFTNFMLKCEKPMNPITFSTYPSYIEVNGDKNDTYGRLGWCYGDINQGYCFYEAFNVLNDEGLLIKSNGIFLGLERRKDIKTQSIRDAGLCHGASGIAVICSNLNSRRANEVLTSLEKYWIGITLDFYKTAAGIEGFKMAKKDSYEFETGLLNGTSGIALSLLSANRMTGMNIDWILLLK
jgi:lantibiotic biosynthesis protein